MLEIFHEPTPNYLDATERQEKDYKSTLFKILVALSRQ